VFLALGDTRRVAPVFAAIDTWHDRDAHAADGDLARLDAVRSERTAAAERYFEDHAAEWEPTPRSHVAGAGGEARMAARRAARWPTGRSAGWSISVPEPDGCWSCWAPARKVRSALIAARRCCVSPAPS